VAKVQTRNAVVEYLVDGRGPGLVLVHGTGGSAELNWANLAERFSRRWKVVRPNYSGSGHTTDAGGPLSPEQLAEQVVEAAKAAGNTPFDLVGFSLGAGVAAVVAAQYPHLIRSVVLVAGFADATDPYLKLEFSIWQDLISCNRPALARLFLMTGFSSSFLADFSESQLDASASAIVTGTNWEGMARQIELNLTLDIREHVRAIAQPTLVIGCTYDCIVPVRHSKQLAGMISNAEYAELATGHLVAGEQPEAFADLVESFLMRKRR
jgi:pimeloyl-ACP methyl ester carboxylesterase